MGMGQTELREAMGPVSRAAKPETGTRVRVAPTVLRAPTVPRASAPSLATVILARTAVMAPRPAATAATGVMGAMVELPKAETVVTAAAGALAVSIAHVRIRLLPPARSAKRAATAGAAETLRAVSAGMADRAAMV